MMTNMKKYISGAGLLGAALLAACSFEKNAVQDIAGPAPTASVKFFNFAVGSPSVNFYANDTKVTAVSSTSGQESTAGTAYGSVATGGFYTALAPGQYTMTGRITVTTPQTGGPSTSAARSGPASAMFLGIISPSTTCR